MSSTQTTVSLSAEVIAEVDSLVGDEHRSAFLEEAAGAELRRRRLLQFVADSRIEPAWKDKDHPELADGTYTWVRKLRDEWEVRLQALHSRPGDE